jgi:hypothetical protein
VCEFFPFESYCGGGAVKLLFLKVGVVNKMKQRVIELSKSIMFF